MKNILTFFGKKYFKIYNNLESSGKIIMIINKKGETMNKNIMLTVFCVCVILILVGCKNGYESIKGDKSDKDADKSQIIEESLVEKISSRKC